ncbi:MAG: hypothetical protein KQH53_14450 [Desulfarculaceae bacterium]|nr:hypothetical protein [Desulfarculaceae bacterium]
MKTLMIVMLCAAALLTAGSAQAYAIYNHTNYYICLKKWYDYPGECHVYVDPHSTHNGEHGAGLSSVYAYYGTKKHDYESDKFSIPKGGYARIYDREIKIYTHHGKHKNTVRIDKED